MSNLQQLIIEAKKGLSVQERISDTKWREIATKCGPKEIEEIVARIASLHAELETVEEWDGDTQDDFHLAVSRFQMLLELARRLQESQLPWAIQ